MSIIQTEKLWVVVEIFSSYEIPIKMLDNEMSHYPPTATPFGTPEFGHVNNLTSLRAKNILSFPEHDFNDNPLKITKPRPYGDIPDFAKYKHKFVSSPEVRLIGIFSSYEAAKSASSCAPNRVLLGPSSVSNFGVEKTFIV